MASRSKCGDVCFASFERELVYNQRISLYTAGPQGRREKLGLKANLGRRMDLTLNIYPEVRIGLEPNLRQIEFRVFCRLVIFQPVNSKEANIGSTQFCHKY